MPTVSLPPRLRFGLYIAFAIANVFLAAWNPKFGYTDYVDYGVRVIAGLSAALFGVAGSNIFKADPSVAPSATSSDNYTGEFVSEPPATDPVTPTA